MSECVISLQFLYSCPYSTTVSGEQLPCETDDFVDENFTISLYDFFDCMSYICSPKHDKLITLFISLHSFCIIY